MSREVQYFIFQAKAQSSATKKQVDLDSAASLLHF
jgi:hypothetical protein